MSVKIRSNQTLPRGARCSGGWPENSSGATRYDTRRSVRLNGQKDPRAAGTKPREGHANPGGKPHAPFGAHFSSDCHILRVGTVE